MSKSDSIAKKLGTPEGAAVLADRWLADVLDRKVTELVRPAEAAQLLLELLSGFAASEDAEALLVARADAFCKRFENESQPVGTLVHGPLQELALRLARRPHQPHRDVALRVLDREPVRQLIRALLIDALIEFGRKVASPISGSKVGRGLGTLGSIAGAVGAGVLGAVGGELEKQVERKASEFADSALSRIIHNLVDMVTDPRLAREQGEMRATLVQGVLEVPAKLWVAEVRRADPKALAGEVRRAAREFTQREGARAELEAELTHGLEPLQGRTVRDELKDLGLLDAVLRGGRDALVLRIQAFDWQGAFGALG